MVVTQGCFLDAIYLWVLGNQPSTCTWVVLVSPAVWALGDWLMPLPALPPTSTGGRQDPTLREASCWAAEVLAVCSAVIPGLVLPELSARPYLRCEALLGFLLAFLSFFFFFYFVREGQNCCPLRRTSFSFQLAFGYLIYSLLIQAQTVFLGDSVSFISQG